jgi:hypothetical protein
MVDRLVTAYVPAKEGEKSFPTMRGRPLPVSARVDRDEGEVQKVYLLVLAVALHESRASAIEHGDAWSIGLWSSRSAWVGECTS